MPLHCFSSCTLRSRRTALRPHRCVNRSVIGPDADMDEVTQHNAALVEESAATANSLADQARQLSELTAAFKIASDAALREAAV